MCRNPTSTNTTGNLWIFNIQPKFQIYPKKRHRKRILPLFHPPLDTDLSTIGTVVEDNYDVYRDVVAQKNGRTD